MENQDASEKIQETIHQLENQQAQEESGLKEELSNAYETFKPANLIKNTLHDVISSPQVQQDVVTASLGLAAGYAAKKVLLGESDSTLSKVAGTFIELGVAKVVSQHEEDIKLLGLSIYRAIRDRARSRYASSI